MYNVLETLGMHLIHRNQNTVTEKVFKKKSHPLLRS